MKQNIVTISYSNKKKEISLVYTSVNFLTDQCCKNNQNWYNPYRLLVVHSIMKMLQNIKEKFFNSQVKDKKFEFYQLSCTCIHAQKSHDYLHVDVGKMTIWKYL